MEKKTGSILHWAEERGQSRELKAEEVGATAKMSLIETGALALLAFTCVLVFQAVVSRDVDLDTAFTAFLTALAIAALAFYINVTRNFSQMRESQSSYRQVETYAPPQPEPMNLPHPPIAVYPPGKKEPYLLTEAETPGREPLHLTPGTIAEILQLAIERNKGTWSRRTLTALRLATGEKLSRGIYEQLTPWLFRAGVLKQEPQGGYRILAEDLEELRQIFPNLPIPETGQAGGEPGDWAGIGFSDAQPADRGVGTLAERHRLARMNELEHSVRSYLERK